MSVKDPQKLELLKALHPVVFQTPLDSDSSTEQSKLVQDSINCKCILHMLMINHIVYCHI